MATTRSALFLAASFSALLHLQACRCDDSAQCPAFDRAAALYAVPAGGDSLRFRDDAGQRIVFAVSEPFLSPAYAAPTSPEGLFGGCRVAPCEAGASFDATSVIHRNGSHTLSMHYNSSSDAGGMNAYISGSVLDFYFYTGYGTAEPTDTTLYDFTLGTRVYDTLLVRRRDTTTAPVESLAVWRVYLHSPDGVVGFEDRVTGSLFFRE